VNFFTKGDMWSFDVDGESERPTAGWIESKYKKRQIKSTWYMKIICINNDLSSVLSIEEVNIRNSIGESNARYTWLCILFSRTSE
jgi:hypothetical protein